MAISSKHVTTIYPLIKFSSVQILKPFQKFFKKIVEGSILLFVAAVTAIAWANISPDSYNAFWHTELSLTFGHIHITKSLIHWISEALMALFFFTVGLEIKREILVGELASARKAILPVAAAAGGMLVPALIYLMFNLNTPAARGWGIPMATDIAFSLAVLAVLGKKIPFGLRIFLSAFAIADDLGSVLVIALFYTQHIAWGYLLLAMGFVAALAIANILWIRWAIVYALLGIGMWFAILGSGIHATVAGVIVAMFVPARGKYDTGTFINKVKSFVENLGCDDGCGYTILENRDHQNAVHNIELACHEVETPLQRFEYGLNAWVAFFILPMFAIANSGITLQNINVPEALFHPVTLGTMLGLVIGKPVGITLFAYLSVKLLKTPLQGGMRWIHIVGASMLGGIGFTMSLFISSLSFSSNELIEFSKFGIILASVASGILGLAFLWYGMYFTNETNNGIPNELP